MYVCLSGCACVCSCMCLCRQGISAVTKGSFVCDPAVATLPTTINTFVGSGFSALNDGTGTGASFVRPTAVAYELRTGFLWVGDYDAHVIRKVSPFGVVTTVAGNTTAGWADGRGTQVMFNLPWSIFFEPSTGNAFIADFMNNRIRKITPDGNVTTAYGRYIVEHTFRHRQPCLSVLFTLVSTQTFSGPLS